MKKIEDFSHYKKIFLQIFLIGGIIFSSLFFLRPKVIEIFKIRKEIKIEKEKLTKLNQKVAYLEGLDEAELTQKTQVLIKALPLEEDIPLILTTLKSISFSKGISLQGIQISLGGESPKTGLSSFSFSLELEEEELENLISFINSLEISCPLMRVEMVESSFEGKDKMREKISVQSFFLPPPKELPTLDSPLAVLTSQEEKIYQDISSFYSPLEEENFAPVQSGKENPFSF